MKRDDPQQGESIVFEILDGVLAEVDGPANIETFAFFTLKGNSFKAFASALSDLQFVLNLFPARKSIRTSFSQFFKRKEEHTGSLKWYNYSINNMRVVAGVIFNNENKILITRRARGQSRELLWEFPGGKVEEGESDEEALKREIKEELCLDIEVLSFFTRVIHSYPDLDIELVAYLCKLKGGKICLTVHEEYRWINPAEVLLYSLADADRKIGKRIIEEFNKNKEDS